MKATEIIKLFDYTNKETTLYMPNEIFDDLLSSENLEDSSHIAFAYSYVYLCTWLYRYCKYYYYEKMTQDKIKQILGYAKTNKTLDYMIKKDGVLETLGYLETTTDFPILLSIDDGFLDFYTNEQNKADCPIRLDNYKNFKVKLPIKAFHRTQESVEERVLDGTYYDVYKTHLIPFEVFMYCMSYAEINTVGFYLYAFLKHKNDLFTNGVDISLQRIMEETGIKATTLDTYLTKLKEHNMIDCIVQPYVLNLPQHLWQANTYKTEPYVLFGKKSVSITKRKVMSLWTYEKEYGKIGKQSFDFLSESPPVIDIDDNMLPF
ncbi:hypothetical protein [Paenibacillus sp. N3.4]|uniref:hypothetical protein n=1 Tax=Paenibacillus sp. N3.4 TaxID=2603222 RepID=UPI0011CA01DD|nr:hypothetical protein [Paenibacillus sp. N3.4]TXK75440.1 hypothetical protein FU659_27525 [Paenibacillus sp. N3.4]